MANRQLDEEAIFHVARGIDNLALRSTYLDQVCAGDQALRERVEALLGVHEQEQSFLQSDDVPAPTADPTPVSEAPGQQIGRYKLLQKIGEGGFGVVFMAEQVRPVRRKVALKIIKPGMDTHTVVARFEAERQALALMDHANIARVLDGGATESGRPYFVMELVKGVPLTEYCDANNLSTRERLKLFATVCQAVQHAHQKGIIHRDLKPSNILATLADGKPVVKVIDFGVAKALNQQLTEKTLFTSFGQMIGTPQYMSPEQAEMSCLDVDTRSDIFSLGVLLYELLTGMTPLESERLRTAGYAEMQRIIREEEPLKPSTRLSRSGEHLTIIAKHRGVSSDRLHKLVRGELDWIVMKALAKDRSRRYETASSLAADLDRHLSGEPIEACPPSTVYRLRKAASRHRGALVAVAAIVMTLLLATSLSAWLAVYARSKQTEAEERLRLAAEAMIEQAVASALLGNNDRASKAADSAEIAGGAKSQIEVIRGLVALNQGDFDEAARRAEIALKHLSPNLREQSESIGARAIRASASMLGGKAGYVFENEWRFMRGMIPKSDTDRLLKANALVLTDPNEGVAALDTLTSLHSPVGLLVRAKAGYLQGMDQQDSVLLEKAVTDFEYLQDILHGSQGVIAWRLATLTSAINFARREERLDDVERHTAAGRDVVAQFLSTSAHASYRRWLFYRAIGEPQRAVGALTGAEEPRWISWYLAADCMARNTSTSDAKEEFDGAFSDYDHKDAFYRLGQAHLVRNLDNGEQQTRECLEGLLDHESEFIVCHALWAYCLVDTRDEITNKAADALKSLGDDRESTDTLWGGVEIEYMADIVSETELLERAGQSQFSTAAAHLTIAMTCLAEGNRSTAQKHFAKAVATNTVGCEQYEIALAYHKRLADSDWPQWLTSNATDTAKD